VGGKWMASLITLLIRANKNNKTKVVVAWTIYLCTAHKSTQPHKLAALFITLLVSPACQVCCRVDMEYWRVNNDCCDS
jgi:hypothetical protein